MSNLLDFTTLGVLGVHFDPHEDIVCSCFFGIGPF